MRRLNRSGLSTGLLCLAALCTPASASNDAAGKIPALGSSTWALRVPDANGVSFQGQANRDGAGGGTAQIMYPAPNMAGFIAALVTHGLINESSKTAERQRIQEQANRILEPYADVLSVLSYRTLIEHASGKIDSASSPELIGSAEASSRMWIMEVTPLYVMTPDQRAIVLDNTVRVFANGSKNPVYSRVIRVVSFPLEDMDETAIIKAWRDGDGALIRSASSDLLAESLKIALLDARSVQAAEERHRTFRYREGGFERIERAQLVSEECHRQVLRTLRGWLLSIPSSRHTTCSVSAHEVEIAASNKPENTPNPGSDE
ncbi:hypothetical protein [Methyloversatilis universalis]|uniref:hypothetical protein n=1 Tax=Methyloversatilis universalis TaxID=378211 RepID=UPI00056143DA|nr:hypothetical protein [Methyloversatilis universalis]